MSFTHTPERRIAESGPRSAAEAAKQQYSSALHLFPPSSKGWPTRVMTCSALQHEGIPEIWRTVLQFREQMKKSGYFARRRAEQARRAMHDSIQHELLSHFLTDPEVQARIHDLETDVEAGRLSAFRAALQLLKIHNGNSHAHRTTESDPADR